jgi:aspartate-semialdehyde dehydrogenase
MKMDEKQAKNLLKLFKKLGLIVISNNDMVHVDDGHLVIREVNEEWLIAEIMDKYVPF